MNIQHHPDLLDRLAAAYALGTLRGGARRRFESLAREHAGVRAAAQAWQTRMANLAELQGQSAPAPAVWTRIDNLVRAEREQQAMLAARTPDRASVPAASAGSHAGWWRSLGLWRATTAAGVAATVLAVVLGLNQRDQLGRQLAALRAELQTATNSLAAPATEYVAVLADEQSSAAMLVTFDPKKGTLVLQRVGAYQESADKSLQLWALPPAGGPRSLGVLGQGKVVRLVAGASDVQAVPTLAISLEPRGGVPGTGGPTGPVLFKGALIQKAE